MEQFARISWTRPYASAHLYKPVGERIVQIAGHGPLSFIAPGFAEHVIAIEDR